MICNYENCRCESGKNDCGCMKGIMVLVSIIGGIVFAAAVVLLFINSFLTQTGFFVWTALISALVYLFTVIAVSAAKPEGKAGLCVRCNTAGLFTGIFGTVFSGALAVSAVLTAGEIFSAIILALTAFFFAFMIISALFLVKCITE